MSDLHPAVASILEFFEYSHLSNLVLRDTSKKFHDLAHDLVDGAPMHPELTVCLRKLLEAKDCAVRARLRE